jgi:ribonuclease HI
MWCNKWGFILSKEKTIAVIFTHKRIDGKTNLFIDKSPIAWNKEVKFLGVIFDERLTWASHINYITERCKKRLNLMRCLSGTSWGANKKCLLMIYKALVRSVIDYGCIAYDNASEAIKTKLDRIQSQALKICCGAMKSTAISAMQVECGEAPLQIRRDGQINKYNIKINAIKDHPTAQISQIRGYKSRAPKPSFASKAAQMSAQNKIKAIGPTISPLPPWHCKQADCILDTLYNHTKESPPELIKQIVLNKLSNFDNSFCKVYSDGSKDIQGRAGASFCIPSLKTDRYYRLTDDVSIYTAEMIAIKEALQYVRDHQITKTLILSDSLSVLQSIETGHSPTRPNTLITVQSVIHDIYKYNGIVSFMWVPSHVGIAGNERADKLAKLSLSNQQIDINIPLEIKEAYAEVDKQSLQAWQEKWNNETTGRHYHAIEPIVSNKIKYTCTQRAKETYITRLRLGKCNLNHYLKQISRHDTGLCAQCNEPETIDHFLNKCIKNKSLTSDIQKICRQNKKPPLLSVILGDQELIDVVYDHSVKSRDTSKANINHYTG